MPDLELLAGIGAVPIIIGAIQLAKSMGLNAKWAGVGAVVLGVGLSFLYSYFADAVWYNALITGLAVGLSSAGLYSTAKSINELKQ